MVEIRQIPFQFCDVELVVTVAASLFCLGIPLLRGLGECLSQALPLCLFLYNRGTQDKVHSKGMAIRKTRDTGDVRSSLDS